MIKSICLKEVKSYFKKPTALIFIGIFFMSAAFRFVESLVMGSTDIQALFSQYAGYIWVLLPILSVSLIPDEISAGTDRLLFTSPGSCFEIVFGKFLASLIVFTVGLISTILFTLVFIIHAKPGFMLVLNTYFALFMYGSAILAIGLFFGSALKNTVAGLAASFGLIIFMNQITVLKMITEFPQWLGKIVDFLSINDKYNAFFGTLVSPEAFVYFFSLTVIFLLLSALTVRKRSSN